MSDDYMTAGKQLQQARETSHMSLTELSEKTKIPVQCLKDIEQDHYPDPRLSIYTRGHIKLYCEALQIPVEPIITALNQAGIEYTDAAKHNHIAVNDDSPFFRIEYLVVAAIWLGWLLYNYASPEPSPIVAANPVVEAPDTAPASIPLIKAGPTPASPLSVKESHSE